MKILLKRNIEKLGKSGDIVEVANGYARNYLLPRMFATTVTPGNIKQINLQRKKQEGMHREEIEKLQELANEISDISYTIIVKTNEEGKLFGSVTAPQIANTISEKGFQINDSMVVLETPIKKCDLYNITVALHPEVKTKCRVWVVSESEKASDAKNGPVEPTSQNKPEE